MKPPTPRFFQFAPFVGATFAATSVIDLSVKNVQHDADERDHGAEQAQHAQR